MTLVLRDPWQLVHNWRNQAYRDMKRGLTKETEHDEACDWKPAADIVELKERYLLRADIPGVKPEQIDVSSDNGVLSIKGSRARASEEESADYKRIERVSGQFERRFSLPEDADVDSITASVRDGVLQLVIPKSASAQPRRIEVQS